ncbi:hypothetical protein Hamer_G008302 [Homarus americanus]|uniref:Uncharacterized protein n=1 Tax=Homarus americanus TaxID=6706 RepID=A0A8J5NDG2_HOMAM|nr:hypothetical protein Hamer_G008302 [Homarus americanus]
MRQGRGYGRLVAFLESPGIQLGPDQEDQESPHQWQINRFKGQQGEHKLTTAVRMTRETGVQCHSISTRRQIRETG